MRPPSVDRLARELSSDSRLAGLPLPLLVRCAREAVASHPDTAADEARRRANELRLGLWTDVINATGVLLHTNLGRAPHRSGHAPDAVRYSNLELDLLEGERGSRQALVGPLLAELCGAEAALVVNNCAAALVLVLAALARDRAVAVSRGELVEIGGGFRVPEVLEQSGARLVEVGTTNRTRLVDYERAAAANHDLAMVLKVHPSNYEITGFTETVEVDALSTLGIPIVADIGSGLLDSRTPWLADGSGRIPRLPWLDGEPAAKQTLEAGADLVVFSCDKLLGGVQGGAIVGSNVLVQACAKHPLARALRPGGSVVRSLHSTLLAYLRRDLSVLPFWQMATVPVGVLEQRASSIARRLGERVEASPCDSVTGGGTLPSATIASHGLRVAGDVVRALRRLDPPVIARSSGGSTWLDLRTVDPVDDDRLASGLASIPGLG